VTITCWSASEKKTSLAPTIQYENATRLHLNRSGRWCVGSADADTYTDTHGHTDTHAANVPGSANLVATGIDGRHHPVHALLVAKLDRSGYQKVHQPKFTEHRCDGRHGESDAGCWHVFLRANGYGFNRRRRLFEHRMGAGTATVANTGASERFARRAMTKGLRMTREQAEAHQRKHGFAVESVLGRKLQPYQKAMLGLLPKPRMNKTESEYALILEAMKRRGEIVAWKFEGISLSWGADPKTGKPMWFTPDFTVWVYGAIQVGLIEVKGAHVFSRDLVRYKGCRAEWGMWFIFQMHQKKQGEWKRIH
jgi:hypothetical protein